jgi:O-antigen/teichoic acid export membrane protein
MRRKFTFNLIFLLAMNLLVKPLWIFGIDRGVQNSLGPEVYGTYFAVLNFSFLFSVILDFGIYNFNNRAVSRNPGRIPSYLPNLFSIKMVLSVLYFAITALVAISSGLDKTQLQLLAWLALNQFLLSMILYLRSNISGLHLFKADTVLSVSDRLLTIAFCAVLMYWPGLREDFDIFRFIYAQTFALSLTAVLAFAIILSNTKATFTFWKPRFTKAIFIHSLPFALVGLLMGIYYRVDAFMIERMLGDRGAMEAGIYAAGYRMLDAANMIAYLFSVLLLPMFSRMVKEKAPVKDLLNLSSSLLFLLSWTASIACYFFRNEMVEVLYHRQDAYWGNVFGWLMISFIPISSVYVYGTLLLAKGTLREINIIATLGLVLNLGLNLYLIPHYGALGATFATLFTQLLVVGGQIYVTHRVFALQIQGKRILQWMLFVALSIGIFLVLRLLYIHWMAQLAIGLLVHIPLVLLTGIFPVRHIFSLAASLSAKVDKSID